MEVSPVQVKQAGGTQGMLWSMLHRETGEDHDMFIGHSVREDEEKLWFQEKKGVRQLLAA